MNKFEQDPHGFENDPAAKTVINWVVIYLAIFGFVALLGVL